MSPSAGVPSGRALILRAAMVLGLISWLACGDRARDVPPPEPAPILVVGMDGLEWRAALDLMRRGKMPVMSRLMREGVYGKLDTLQPTRSPAIWTSIATGKVPEKHGILDGVLTDPVTGKLRIARRTDRETKAIWNIFSDFGLRVHSVGWYMTYPAEPIHGVMTAQMNWMYRFRVDGGSDFLPGRKHLEGMVSPREFQERVMQIALEMREKQEEREEAIFGPAAQEPHSPLGRRMWDSGHWVITLDGIHLRIALEILEREEPFSLMLLYLRGADVLSHNFWRFANPEDYENPPGPEEASRYSSILDAYYRFLDESLGTLMDATEERKNVIVLSDHGMDSGNTSNSFLPEGGRMSILSGGHDEAPPGVFLAAGPQIRRAQADLDLEALEYDTLPLIGSILDVAPTILALEGLPVGEDMDGRALVGILEAGDREEFVPSYVESYDALGEFDMEEGRALTSEEVRERLEELRSLGYME